MALGPGCDRPIEQIKILAGHTIDPVSPQHHRDVIGFGSRRIEHRLDCPAERRRILRHDPAERRMHKNLA
jgi:hypothetical protein